MSKTRKSRKVFSYSKFWQLLQLNIQKRQKWNETKTLPCTPNRKIGILGKFSLTSNFYSSCKLLVPNLYFLDRGWSLIFLWLLILSHVFPENFIKFPQVAQKIWRFSSPIFGVFNFWSFLTFHCYKEINDVSI